MVPCCLVEMCQRSSSATEACLGLNSICHSQKRCYVVSMSENGTALCQGRASSTEQRSGIILLWHHQCVSTRGMTFFDEGLPNKDKAFRVIIGGPEGKIVGEHAGLNAGLPISQL